MTAQRDMSGEIEVMIAPSLEAMGYRLVRVLVAGGRRPTLQIMAERDDERPMTTDDCAEISRAVSALLDVEDPFPGPYTLEVSSPGLDRPLTRPQDYVRFAGSAARLETRLPINGRRRFKGTLLGLEGESVRLSTDAGEAAIPLAEIARAKLMITEELLAADRRRRRQTDKL